MNTNSNNNKLDLDLNFLEKKSHTKELNFVLVDDKKHSNYVKSENKNINNVILPMILICFIIIVTLLALLSNSNKSTTTQTNNSIDFPTAIPTPSFDYSCLSLSKGAMTQYSNNLDPTYVASIYNGCDQAVRDVGLTINFYVAGDNSNSAPEDTRYIDSGITYLAPGKYYYINEVISTKANTTFGNFMWNAIISNADPY